MAAGLILIGGGGTGSLTKAFGTRIQFLIPGRGNAYTHLIHFSYTSLATAHTVTIMKGVDWTVLALAAATGQAKVVLKKTNLQSGTPANIGNGDILAIRQPDGTWLQATVSSLAADNITVTLSGNLTQALQPGARVVSLGQASQAAHALNTYLPTISTTTEFPPSNFVGSLQRSVQKNEPLLFDSNNITAAGILNNLQWGYAISG